MNFILSDIEQQGLRLILTPYSFQHLGGFSSDEGYRIFIRNLQDNTITLDEGFDANLGMATHATLKMTEFEKIPPDLGGNCAPDSYLTERFDPKVFSVTNETIYTVEVESFVYNIFLTPLE